MFFGGGGSYGASASDDASSSWGSPYYRRAFGPGTEPWVEEAACCLCGCLSTGPVFIVIGLLFLFTALTDPRYQGIRAYDRDVTAWTQAQSGGMAQLASTFPSGSLLLQLSSAGSARVDSTPVSVTAELTEQTSVSPLSDNGTNIDTYTSSLWYEGPAPAWLSWPSGDEYASVRPVGAVGAAFDAANLQLVQCSNERSEGYGANCSEAAAPPPAAGSARRLNQQLFGPPSCQLFYRVVRTPAAVALQLSPPRGCVTAGGARCRGRNWTTHVLPEGCGTSYVTTATQVSESTWIQDLRSGSPWCSNWTQLVDSLPSPPMVSARSEYDPYVQAALLTGCAYNFGPTTLQYAAFALNLIAFGAAVVTIAGCCLAALVARTAARQAGEGGSEGTSGWAGNGGGYSYGSTRGGSWYGSTAAQQTRGGSYGYGYGW